MAKQGAYYAYPTDNGQIVHKMLARGLADCGQRVDSPRFQARQDAPPDGHYCHGCRKMNARVFGGAR